MPADMPPRYLIDRSIRVVQQASPSDSSSQPVAKSTQVLQFTMQEVAADWFTRAVERISQLTALAPNWDTYGAKAIQAESAMAAVQFLMRSSLPDVPEPAIVPLDDGGIQIEWHQGGMDLEIAFSDADPGVFFDSADGIADELPIDEAQQAVRTFVAGLSVPA